MQTTHPIIYRHLISTLNMRLGYFYLFKFNFFQDEISCQFDDIIFSGPRCQKISNLQELVEINIKTIKMIEEKEKNSKKLSKMHLLQSK